MAVGFYFDSTVCTECKACQIACKDLHDVDASINLRKVYCVEGGAFPKPWVYHLSVACNHCDNPACIPVCPVGSITKADDGSVIKDLSVCIGCKSCTEACPYGAPKYIESVNLTYKCDACKDLRDKGENPVCVDACNMRALEFGDIEELRKKHEGENLTSDLPPLPSSSETTPNFIVNMKQIDNLEPYSLFGVE